MSPEPQPQPRTVEVVRVIDAPRARVFQAWTDPAHAAQWYGPHGYTVPVCEIDPRPGGRFRICMRSSKGVECWETGTYREFAPPGRIVSDYTVTFGDHPAVELSTTVIFEDLGEGTRVTVQQTFFDEHFTQGARAGTEESLDRLAAHLATRNHPERSTPQ
jgi:uncharacterized protein YndB with AHSA1/START domain